MYANLLFVLLAQVVALCHAAPYELGSQFDKRAGSLPTLTLPYGTYRAKTYNPNGDVRALGFHPY